MQHYNFVFHTHTNSNVSESSMQSVGF